MQTHVAWKHPHGCFYVNVSNAVGCNHQLCLCTELFPPDLRVCTLLLPPYYYLDIRVGAKRSRPDIFIFDFPGAVLGENGCKAKQSKAKHEMDKLCETTVLLLFLLMNYLILLFCFVFLLFLFFPPCLIFLLFIFCHTVTKPSSLMSAPCAPMCWFWW